MLIAARPTLTAQSGKLIGIAGGAGGIIGRIARQGNGIPVQLIIRNNLLLSTIAENDVAIKWVAILRSKKHLRLEHLPVHKVTVPIQAEFNVTPRIVIRNAHGASCNRVSVGPD